MHMKTVKHHVARLTQISAEVAALEEEEQRLLADLAKRPKVEPATKKRRRKAPARS